MSRAQTIDLGLGHVRIADAQGMLSLGSEYGTVEGSSVLRELIASWEKVSAEEIAITTGASLGLVATLATLERPCSILCPRPYYPAYPKVANMLGLEVIYYDLERARGWQPDPQRMAKLLRKDTKALLLNLPGNPTGSLMSPALLEEIKEIVEQTNLLVITDEVYADYVYDGIPFPNMRTVFACTPVVRLRSFSKLFGMPGERLGYVVADSNNVRAICQAHWTLAMSPPATAQAVALMALRSAPDRQLRETLTMLADNRDRARQILASCDKINFSLPPAGIFFWVVVPSCRLDSRALAQACAADAGVIVMPGAVFGVDDPTYLRLSFALPKEEMILGFESLIGFLEAIS